MVNSIDGTRCWKLGFRATKTSRWSFPLAVPVGLANEVPICPNLSAFLERGVYFHTGTECMHECAVSFHIQILPENIRPQESISCLGWSCSFTSAWCFRALRSVCVCVTKIQGGAICILPAYRVLV